MKKALLLICIFMSVTTTMTAKRKHIKLNRAHLCKQARARIVMPEVSHDGNILYVESQNNIPNITISVKDMETGDVVFEENVSFNGEMPFFTNLSDGEYEVEMTIGDKVFIGQFCIGNESEVEYEME